MTEILCKNLHSINHSQQYEIKQQLYKTLELQSKRVINESNNLIIVEPDVSKEFNIKLHLSI